jgi:hypothetical protein
MLAVSGVPPGPRYSRAVSRRSRWLLLLVALLLAAAAALLAATRPVETEAGGPVPSPAVASAAPAPPPPPALARAPGPPLSTAAPTPAPGPAQSPTPVPVIDEGYPVNLEALRAEIPLNRYWIDSAPTDDPEVSKRREAEAAEWNQLHGKVLSGTASNSEIRAWIDHRRRVSEDAIEFAQRVLAEHGSELPDRDRGLLELAISMHQTRLDELPRREAEARARKAEQDRRRADWNGRPTP